MRRKGEKSMKAARHQHILEVIAKRDVETQEELARLLRESGIDVTQATVSRDIKELRLFKVLGEGGVSRYAAAQRERDDINDRLIRLFSESVLTMDHAGNMIVMKTLSGAANAAAQTIDSLKWPWVLGTLAGDDTILIIVRDEHMVQEVLDRFAEMVKR